MLRVPLIGATLEIYFIDNLALHTRSYTSNSVEIWHSVIFLICWATWKLLYKVWSQTNGAYIRPSVCCISSIASNPFQLSSLECWSKRQHKYFGPEILQFSRGKYHTQICFLQLEGIIMNGRVYIDKTNWTSHASYVLNLTTLDMRRTREWCQL